MFESIKKTFSFFAGEHKHPEENGQNTEVVCEICSKGFPQKSQLYWHILTVHDNEEQKCDLCNSTFQNKNELTNHKSMVHNPDQMKINNVDHEMVEILDDDFPVEIVGCKNCDKKFVNEDDLNSHMKNTHKIFECSECSTCFKSSKDLKWHIKSEHKSVDELYMEIGKFDLYKYFYTWILTIYLS